MANVIFTPGLVEAARRSLRNGDTILDALVIVGGHHFEMGKQEFAQWCEAVVKEIPDGLRQANRGQVLAEAYVRMRDRAYELARTASNRGVPRATLSGPLNAFMGIDRSHTRESGVLAPPIVNQSNSHDARNPMSGEITRTGSQASPLHRLLTELHSQIGLDNVKKDIEELANSIHVDRARRAQGLRIADRSLHMVFHGNPGTGKTTVARLVAQIYKELGVLAKGHLICTDRAGLVAEYVGQTATKVAGVVQKALGGVLFIDEAYSLAPPDSRNDFGQEAIQQLLLSMENYRNELVVIVAGYPDEMTRFLDANPGLSSRFTKKLQFEDYSPEELVRIFDKFCSDNDYRLEAAAREALLRTVRMAYSHRDRTFGNARFARNLFEESTKNLHNRLVKSGSLDTADLTLITQDDIPEPMIAPKSANATKQHLPDFGKYLAAKGTPQKTALIYNSWELDDLAVVGRGHYCTTRVQPTDGNLYCATFDFGDEVLGKILARASAATRAFVTDSLAEDPESVRHIRIPNPVNIGVVATLGNLQQGLNELFIPLIVTDVFGVDPSAVMEEMRIGNEGWPVNESEAEVSASDAHHRAIETGETNNRAEHATSEITVADIKAISAYCRHLAKEWWRTKRCEVAICDTCNSPVLRDEGFISDSYLCCKACFEHGSKPDTALNNLRDDADYYGEGLVADARRFSKIRPRP